MSDISGTVFDIQGYSIHDGPGIRTTVFISGCPLRCQWCQNPESNTVQPKLMFFRHKCAGPGCGKCQRACPNGAVIVSGEEIINDRTKCTACGKCVDVCPAKAREISGKVMTAQEVFERVNADRIFYTSSGGGVTLSGGDVLAQPSFSEEILRLCKEAGLSTAIETCGFGSWETLLRILNYTDLVLYDIKHMDPEKHRQGAGTDNKLILDNAKRIRNTLGKDMAIRVPLIPGYNDDRKNMEELALFVLNQLDRSVCINLLPYHRLGEAKHEHLEDGFTGPGILPPSDSRMNELREYLASFDLNVTVGG